MIAPRRRRPDPLELLVVVTAAIAAAVFLSSPHVPAVTAPATLSPHIGASHSQAYTHRGGGVRAAARTDSTHGNQSGSADVLRRVGAVRTQQLALHLASSDAVLAAGVRALAARLLAHLEDLRQRGGRLEHRQLLRGRFAVHVGYMEQRRPVVWRVGAAREFELGDREAAATGADPRRVLRSDAPRQLGRLAEHVAGVRLAVSA
jgi:hypothetical protein